MSAGATLVPISNPATRRRRSRMPRWYRRNEALVLGVSGFMVFLLAWELGARTGAVEEFFFSKPTSIITTYAKEVQVPRFWDDVATSMSELAVGFVGAIGLGVPLGIAIGWYRRLGYMFDPWLNFFNALPRIALLPLIVLWLGLGVEAKYFLVFLAAFFSIVVPTSQGVKTVDRTMLDVGRSLGASQRRIFTTIVLPSTVPFMIAGVRLGIGRGLAGVVVAEFYAQTKGVGVIIVKAGQSLDSSRLLMGVLIFTMSAIVMAFLVGLVEGRVERWRPGLDSEEGGA